MRSPSPFEVQVLPHLAAAYNLARWLLRDGVAAEDAVQDASLRALKYISGMRGENPKAWFLAIVRRCCYDRVAGRDADPSAWTEASFDDHAIESVVDPGPEQAVHLRQRANSLRSAIEALAPGYREVIVLREFEDLSYKEIARVANIPVGTVMSRLARARSLLQRSAHLDEVRDPSQACGS